MQPHLPLYFFTYFSGLGLSLSFWMSGSYWRRQLLGADARKVTWPPRSTFNCFSLITLELQKLQHSTLCGSLSSKNQNSVFCIFRNVSSARGGTSYGAGGPPPQISMQWGKSAARLDLCPHFLMASLYMVQLKFSDSGTMDSLSLNLRPIYYSFSDHSLKDNF